MGMSDVIKKSVLDKFQSGNLSTTSTAIILLMAVLLGLYIYFVYRVTCRSGFYNRSLNKSLATMPVITASIILAMQSNLVISLGMVGALSIVRFRNAVKDPVDLVFLFWSISMGIIAGAGLFELVLLATICVTVLIFFLDALPSFRAPCLLVISSDTELTESELMKAVKKYCPKAGIRSRNVSEQGTEWIVELQVKKQDELIRDVCALQGIRSVNLLSHDGDVRY